ncbi:MAG: hypothetical protein LBQ48_00140 [Oscillospiraceae bacterium]|nr:hypothetical protein [Oscillospiraceae bacterium]
MGAMTPGQAKWIWYPGEFEFWLNQRVASARYQKGGLIPPFWRVDVCYSSITFLKTVELEKPETVYVFAQGEYNVHLLGEARPILNPQNGFPMEAGRHQITVKVFNTESFPAIYVTGETVVSDESWLTGCGDDNWIFAVGWNFTDRQNPPCGFALSVEPVFEYQLLDNGLLDFGKEIMGYLQLDGAVGPGFVKIIYGESQEEALSDTDAYQFDIWEPSHGQSYRFPIAKAFRYIRLSPNNAQCGKLTVYREMLDIPLKASLRSSDEQLNKIWETAQYTLHLNSREFFLDGIKRDRWVWSGDAVQSFLLNFYSFFDIDINRRTLRLLAGKPPVSNHINHIMDYTFFWVIGLYDHYVYTGDMVFLREIYSKMEALLDFCLGRRNADGMMEGLYGDWVFIDWAPMDNGGAVCAEQILFGEALYRASKISAALGLFAEEKKYSQLAKKLKSNIFKLFWKEDKGFIHSVKQGEPDGVVLKYPAIFALLFGWLDKEKKTVAEAVLLSGKIPPITTPYMQFYKLMALGQAGYFTEMLDEIKAYWGGMLDEGATTFWEQYLPRESGAAHFAMYDEPFGRSLCHAWGGGPGYLLGRYFLGVSPTKPGYEEYEVRPILAGLPFIEGTVPTPYGEIAVFADEKKVTVKGNGSVGKLILPGAPKPAVSGKQVKQRIVNIGKNETVTVEV